jgi:hypothetical protein
MGAGVPDATLNEGTHMEEVGDIELSELEKRFEGYVAFCLRLGFAPAKSENWIEANRRLEGLQRQPAVGFEDDASSLEGCTRRCNRSETTGELASDRVVSVSIFRDPR